VFSLDVSRQQRCAVLYGHFTHASDMVFANVDAVWEPPQVPAAAFSRARVLSAVQISDGDAATMLADGACDVADLVAAHLGMQRVGSVSLCVFVRLVRSGAHCRPGLSTRGCRPECATCRRRT
jgi:hypothetical protein